MKKFLYRVQGKCTSIEQKNDLIKFLKNIGYTHFYNEKNPELLYIEIMYDYNDIEYKELQVYFSRRNSIFFTEPRDCYICGENIALFKAIAAINSDDDYMQWFISDCNQSWVNQGTYCPIGSMFISLIKDRYKGMDETSRRLCSSVAPAHKAQAADLCKYYRKKIDEMTEEEKLRITKLLVESNELDEKTCVSYLEINNWDLIYAKLSIDMETKDE